MSIKTYNDPSGRELLRVHVSRRSNKNPSIRVQRMQSGIATRAEAERIERRFRDEALKEMLERERLGCTWGALVEAWERSLPTRGDHDGPITSLSGEDYSMTVRAWTESWWYTPAAQIGPADVKAAMKAVQAAGRSRSTQEKLRTSINAVFNFGIEERWLKGVNQSPAMGLKLYAGRKEEKRPEILSYTQIQTLLDAAKYYKDPWYPVWAMALLTGMRSGELYALLWSDIDWEHMLVHVNKSYNRKTGQIGPTKAGYWRDVPISRELEVFLRELRATSQGRQHVLPRLGDWTRGEQAKRLREFCRGIEIPSVRFHTLRACFATQLLSRGVPSIAVMKIGGWKTLKTMERYIRLSGIDVKGATEGLNFITPAGAMAAVVDLFKK